MPPTPSRVCPRCGEYEPHACHLQIMARRAAPGALANEESWPDHMPDPEWYRELRQEATE